MRRMEFVKEVLVKDTLKELITFVFLLLFFNFLIIDGIFFLKLGKVVKILKGIFGEGNLRRRKNLVGGSKLWILWYSP